MAAAISNSVRELKTPIADELGERSADAILGANPFVGFDRAEMVASAGHLIARALLRPDQLAESVGKLVVGLGKTALGRFDGAPASGDRRFADPTWLEHPFYSRWMQAYLLCASSLHEMVDKLGFDEKNARRAEFAVTLLTEALAPTNLLAGNPAAIKRAFETGGRSLLRGLATGLTTCLTTAGCPHRSTSGRFRWARLSR